MNRQDLLQDKRQIWLRHSGTVSSIADETAGIAEMCRGTKGSNPPPSSGESGKLRPLRAENPGLSCRGTRSSNPSSSSRESSELRLGMLRGAAHRRSFGEKKLAIATS